MKIRTMAAVFAAKSAGFICRKMGRQGVTWAGKIALKINPDILEDLSSQVRKKIFVIFPVKFRCIHWNFFFRFVPGGTCQQPG